MTSEIGKRRAAARDEGKAAYQLRRAEIIAAAGEIFKRHGYRGAKLVDVAEALQLDRASLYYYVGSKEELFHDVVGGAVERNTATAEGIVAGPGTAPDKLRALVTGLMVSYSATYPFLYVYIQENLGNISPDRSDWAREMAHLNKRYENAVVAIVQEGIDAGAFTTSTQPWVIAYGIIGMVAWSNRWFDPGESPIPAEEIGSAYADALLAGLQVR